ncbi:MAG: LysR family transcriptional regulator, partial [Nitratireductor sp.]
MDTLLSIRVFSAVAELKSFTAVAQRMNLSPAMTSKHIQHIETRLGARLLNRNSRNVSLTEAGAQYLQTVRPLLEGLEEAESQLSSDTIAPRGTLKISMPVWMINAEFAKILANFQKQNPEVVFDVDLSGRKINIVEEGYDLALRVTAALDEGLIARKLMEVTFQLVAAPSFLDEYSRPNTPEDLIGAPMLAYDQVAADGHIKFGDKDGLDVKLKPVMVSSNENLLYLATKAGMGFAMLPNWATSKDLQNGNLELVMPHLLWPKLHIHAIY